MEAGEEIARYEIANLRALKKLIKEENIDCDFIVTRTCNVFTNQEDVDKSKEDYELLENLVSDALGANYSKYELE